MQRSKTAQTAVNSSKESSSKLIKSNSITPAQCPLSGCDQSLMASNFLQHYLRDHSSLSFISIDDRETMLFHFEESAFPLNIPYCLGVLAYGGRQPGRPEQQPVKQGYAVENQFLPQRFKELKNHLPVLVMACRKVPLAAGESVPQGDHDGGKNVSIVFWLLTMGTGSVQVVGYLSIGDLLLRHQRRRMVKVCELTNSSRELPGIVCLAKEWNLLELNRSEIDLLSHDGTSLIKLEVMIDGPC
ncbi:uncharacterized protein LOC126565300 [Anopheles maculipalpis]|uniref:uncharacterized protein LOC126565300 n=1 Tax=Anopheles maculipalpis TaxID=1496333 RepID=UPI0021596579|nr:uncharacterized protein LOC126565300 [Anopheles maculipalpis]